MAEAEFYRLLDLTSMASAALSILSLAEVAATRLLEWWTAHRMFSIFFASLKIAQVLQDIMKEVARRGKFTLIRVQLVRWWQQRLWQRPLSPKSFLAAPRQRLT